MQFEENVSVGNVDVYLTNIVMQNLNIPRADVFPNPPAGMNVTAHGVSCLFTFNFEWRQQEWPHLTDSGTGSATPSNGDIFISSQVDTGNGTLQLVPSRILVNFNDLSFRLNGNFGWFYDFVARMMNSSIRETLNRQFEQRITNYIGSPINEQLAVTNFTMPITFASYSALVDASIVAVNASTDPLYFSASDLFSISNPATGEVCPYTAMELPLLDPAISNDTMLLGIVDQSALNCLLWTVYQSNIIQYRFTPWNNNSQIPLSLATNDWSPFLPTLAATYPDTYMIWDVSLAAPPNVSMRESADEGLLTTVVFFVNLLVVNNTDPSSETSAIPVYTMEVTALVAGTGYIRNIGDNETNPVGVVNATSVSITAVILNGTIDPTNDNASLANLSAQLGPVLQSAVQSLVGSGMAIPYVNDYGVRLIEPQIRFHDRYATVATKFDVNPQLLPLQPQPPQ